MHLQLGGDAVAHEVPEAAHKRQPQLPASVPLRTTSIIECVGGRQKVAHQRRA